MPNWAGVPLSGRGSFIVVHDFLADDDEFFVLDNSDWQIQLMTNGDMMTVASSGGDSSMVMGSRFIAQASVTLPEDEPSSVESADCFARGCCYDLWMLRGSNPTTPFDSAPDTGEVWDKAVNTVYQGMIKINPTASGQARRIAMQFTAGAFTPYIEASTELQDFLDTIEPTRYP